jgi:16S rRNA (adenine1518-N6/adenine1519-N6)-dimethyltransferase
MREPRIHTAKKSLGQNFLNSPKALRQIIEASHLSANDVVLEVGPGKGALTEKLLETGATILAVEKDRELIPYLEEKFAIYIKSKKFKLVEADILEYSLPKNIHSYKLVANIPYYITGAIIRKFLDADKQPTHMTLLVQKEVAERMVARDKKESLLSLAVKAYGTPKIISIVPRGAFAPAPSVDSAIIAIETISRKNFKNKKHEERFFELIHKGFAHKRKTLWHNLDMMVTKEKDFFFEKNNLNTKVRAEDLSIVTWLKIALN